MNRMVLLATVLVVPLCAQNPTPLTLADCVQHAQTARSSVTIARQQVDIARAGVAIARAGFLPQAFVGGAFNYNSPLYGDAFQGSGKSGFSFVALQGVHEYITQGNLALDLDTSGRLRAQLARARADQDIANANVILSERDLRRAVAAAYYRLLLAQHMAQVGRASLAEAQAFEQRVQLLTANGEAARADLVKASAEVEFLNLAVNSSELDARLANHDLAAFWTTDVEGPLTLDDALAQPPPRLPEILSPSDSPFLARPEFRLLDAQSRGFLADARRLKADLYPQLSLVAQYGIDSLRYSFADRGYATLVNIRIPVFDWFRARNGERQFQFQAQQVETTREMDKRTFSRDYRDALARVEANYAQIGITDSQVKLSEENYRLAKVRYVGGEGTALDVVTAQSQLAQARANSFTARANYLNARVDLEVAEGK
jgi:outer membrane protein